jgi:hypothetical protein
MCRRFAPNWMIFARRFVIAISPPGAPGGRKMGLALVRYIARNDHSAMTNR